MINKKTVTAILLAAGNSTRYGKKKNKNFEKINDQSVLAYSLNNFEKNEYIDNIIVAIKESERKALEKIIKKVSPTKEIKTVIGGDSRKESVYNCLINTDSDIVIIHDGARPLMKQEYITKCIESMQKYKGVTIGVRSKDTIKIVDENNVVTSTTDRNKTYVIQTPQCFDRKTLLKIHEKYKKEEATDDCSLLEKDNYKVKIISGDYTNIKITTREDLNIAKELLSKTES